MAKLIEEVHPGQFATEVFTLVLPTNTARGVYCGCQVAGSIVQGGQLYRQVLKFRGSGVDIRVYPYTPECHAVYDGPNVYLYEGPEPAPAPVVESKPKKKDKAKKKDKKKK